MVERRLNILGIEPFSGAFRRDMVASITQLSRHRWDWRSLPGRRMHRRLAGAAGWFAEALRKRPPFISPKELSDRKFLDSQWFADTFQKPRRGNQHAVDLLFCTEALNIGELVRQTPLLRQAVPVMYVHDHGAAAVPAQAKEYDFCPRAAGVEMTYLFNAANVARGDQDQDQGQIWFASGFHAAAYLMFLDDLFLTHSGLFASDPRQQIEKQVRVVCPPVPKLTEPAAETASSTSVAQALARPNRRRVIVSAGASDGGAVAALFKRVLTRGEPFELVVIGRFEQDDALPDIPAIRLDPTDTASITAALRGARTYLAIGREPWFDPLAVQALRSGLWLLVPGQDRDCCYDEVVPQSLQAVCLHDGSPARVLNQLQTIWHAGPPELAEEEKQRILTHYDPVEAVRAIDDRLERLVRDQKPAVQSL